MIECRIPAARQQTLARYGAEPSIATMHPFAEHYRLHPLPISETIYWRKARDEGSSRCHALVPDTALLPPPSNEPSGTQTSQHTTLDDHPTISWRPSSNASHGSAECRRRPSASGGAESPSITAGPTSPASTPTNTRRKRKSFYNCLIGVECTWWRSTSTPIALFRSGSHA